MKRIISLAALLLALPVFILAEDFAYVAKQDGNTVYLDITELSVKPAAGDTVKTVLKEEELKNHKGESLGNIYTYGPSGKIVSAEEKFAVAALDGKEALKPGQKMILEKTSSAIPSAELSAAQSYTAPVKTGKEETVEKTAQFSFKSKPLNDAVLSACYASPYSDGKKYLVYITKDNKLKTAFLQDGAFIEKESVQQSAFSSAVSVSCADLKKTGKDQIFVVSANSTDKKTNTSVYEESDGALTKTHTLKWIVKSAQTPAGLTVYAQELYVHNGVRTTPVKELVYEKNKFSTKKVKPSTPAGTSVFAYNRYDFDGDGKEDAVAVLTLGGMNLYPADGKKLGVSGDIAFSGTSNRFSIDREIIRVFPPVLIAENNNGKKMIVAIENVPSIGIIAGPFGSYKEAKLHYFVWDEMGFNKGNSIVINGKVLDAFFVEMDGEKRIMMPVVYENDKTIISVL
ncbi:hypothetical protein Dip518_000920 [Parelusimicrobium proximum]|uniref:hypothetical protein n=1 Tax=Parelusimicrobium proximum TaxID=3228953 RepID=UPI003D183DC1